MRKCTNSHSCQIVLAILTVLVIYIHVDDEIICLSFYKTNTHTHTFPKTTVGDLRSPYAGTRSGTGIGLTVCNGNMKGNGIMN